MIWDLIFETKDLRFEMIWDFWLAILDDFDLSFEILDDLRFETRDLRF